MVSMRECIADTVVCGTPIRKGERVAFGIAFGGGPHVCPGAQLARLEARVLLEVLIEKVERLELEAGHRWEKVPVFWANGPRSLPATIELRSA